MVGTLENAVYYSVYEQYICRQWRARLKMLYTIVYMNTVYLMAVVGTLENAVYYNVYEQYICRQWWARLKIAVH